MRSFTNAAVLAVVLAVGAAADAGAQVVVGTRGAQVPGGGSAIHGYYSPYPGTLYSPFRQAPPVVGGYYSSPGFYNAGFGRTFYPPAVLGSGFTVAPAHPWSGGYYPPTVRGYRRW